MSGRRVLGAAVAGLVLLSACGGGDDGQEVRASDDLSEVVGAVGRGDDADAEPGGIVDVRPMEATLVPDGAAGWEVTYWATGVHGDLVETRGVVLAPDTAVPDGGRPVVAWAHGAEETGVADACSPTNRGAVEIPYAKELLAKGYVLASTDYEGLGVTGEHPYLVGMSSGPSVLDVVRAAGNVPGTGASKKALLMGQAQGGQAVLMGAKMAEEYAPELELLGVVAGAPSLEMRAMMYTASDSQPHFGFFAMVAAGYDYAYDDLSVSELFTEEGLEQLDLVYQGCVNEVTSAFNDVPIKEMMPKTLHHFPNWLKRFEENEVGDVKLPAPVLAVHGADDVIILPIATEIAVERLCKAGSTVEMRIEPGVGNLDLFDKSKSRILDYLDARRKGEKATSNCP